MNLYHLYHYPVDADKDTLELFGEDEECVIGIFSSREKALTVAETLKKKPGFRRWPDGFRILVSVLDGEDYAFKEGLAEFDEVEEADPSVKS